MLNKVNKIINTPLDKNKKEILLDRLNIPLNKEIQYKPDNRKVIDKMSTHNIAQKSAEYLSNMFGLNISADDVEVELIYENDYLDINTFLFKLKDSEYDDMLASGIVLDFFNDIYVIVQQGNKYNAILMESDDFKKQDKITFSKPKDTIKQVIYSLCDKNYTKVRLFENYVLYCDIMNDK